MDLLSETKASTSSGANVYALTKHLDEEVSRPILVMIHGYPQTHHMFRYMIDILPKDLPLFIPDIPGYGSSTKSAVPTDIKAHSKRETGKDILEALHKTTTKSPNAQRAKFPIILLGHDRGARICHRLAVDAQLYPQFDILGVVLVDIVPTIVQFQSFAKPANAVGSFHWPFLAAPYPIPEDMIESMGGDKFIELLITKWAGCSQDVQRAMEIYKAHFKKRSVIEASCADYRAGAGIDSEQQEKDQQEGRKIEMPTLVIYSKDYLGSRYDVDAVWKEWVGAQGKVRVKGIGGGVGHFIPEEAPEETTAELLGWIKEDLGVSI